MYWFLINFLTGDGWDGLDADVTVRVLDSRDEIKDTFREWDWHDRAFTAARTPDEPELVDASCSECGKQLPPQPRGEGPWVCDDCHKGPTDEEIQDMLETVDRMNSDNNQMPISENIDD